MSRIKLSKKLAYILRHDPGSLGLEMDGKGWCNLGDLLKGLKVSRDDVMDVVEHDKKSRYTVKGGMIRANFGHSISSVNVLGRPQTPPKVLYHGTGWPFWKRIKTEGLVKMGRNHVHLTESLDIAKEVGQRKGYLLLLRVDVEKMLKDGYLFYESSGTWLVEGVPSCYLSKVKE